MPAKVFISQEIKSKILELFNANYGSRRIASELDLTRSIIKRIFKELNLDSSSRGTPKRPYKGLEKLCKKCNVVKSIKKFELINMGPNRDRNYRYCKLCEKEFVSINNIRYKLNKIKNDPSWLFNKNIGDLINLSLKYKSKIKIE